MQPSSIFLKRIFTPICQQYLTLSKNKSATVFNFADPDFDVINAKDGQSFRLVI